MQIAIGRLRRRPEFLRVADAKCKSVTPGLILQALRHPHGPSQDMKREGQRRCDSRVGYTATRRVGSAVERNRARRRLRAAAAKIMPAHAKPGYDFVLIARKGTLTRPYPKLLQDLEQALKRLKAYQDGKGSP